MNSLWAFLQWTKMIHSWTKTYLHFPSSPKSESFWGSFWFREIAIPSEWQAAIKNEEPSVVGLHRLDRWDESSLPRLHCGIRTLDLGSKFCSLLFPSYVWLRVGILVSLSGQTWTTDPIHLCLNPPLKLVFYPSAFLSTNFYRPLTLLRDKLTATIVW